MGVSTAHPDDKTVVIALAVHDTVYLVDFSEKRITVDPGSGKDLIADYIISEAHRYEQDNLVKFVGVGLPTTLEKSSPSLCSRLWLDLDIVPIALRPDEEVKSKSFWQVKRVDEQADSMARKCIM